MWLAVLSIWIKFGLSWFVSFILKGEQSVLRKKLPINWLSQLLSYTSNKHFSYTTSCVLWRCVAWFWQTWKRAFLKSGRFTLDENTLRITSGYWRSKLRLMILWIIKVEKRSSPAVSTAMVATKPSATHTCILNTSRDGNSTMSWAVCANARPAFQWRNFS